MAAEFADELDTLGVRVAKLEKAADAVTIAGQARFDYKTHNNGDADSSTLRTRLWVTGQINDDWSYTGMFQSTQDFMDNDAEDSVELKRAYVEGKVGGLDVVAGRWNEFFYNANVCDIFVDGVKATYGDDVKFSVMAGKPTAASGAVELTNKEGGDYMYVASVAGKVGAVDASFNYFKADDAALK